MKDWTSCHRQAFYYANPTYIQARSQTIRDKKLVNKGTKILKTKKNYTKIEKFSQKWV